MPFVSEICKIYYNGALSNPLMDFEKVVGGVLRGERKSVGMKQRVYRDTLSTPQSGSVST
jgi:hypothetical protein